jgi:hypothetical protein
VFEENCVKPKKKVFTFLKIVVFLKGISDFGAVQEGCQD